MTNYSPGGDPAFNAVLGNFVSYTSAKLSWTDAWQGDDMPGSGHRPLPQERLPKKAP